MSWLFFWGTLGAILEVSSLISRAIETRAAKSVSGLSAGFLWFGIEINVAWAMYGLIRGLPPIWFPSLLTLLVFGYGLYRIHASGRPQKQPLLIASTVATVIVVAVYLFTDPVMYVIGLVGSVYIFPQLIRIWRTRDPYGIAPRAWFLTLLFSLVWCAYAITGGFAPLIFANTLQAVLTLLVLIGYWVSVRSKKNKNSIQ